MTNDLEQRFEDFAMSMEGGESIDAVLGSAGEGRRADFMWRDRTVIVELKTLTEDPQPKVDQMFEDIRKDGDGFPLIFGTVPTNLVFDSLPDGERQKSRLHQKMLRSVEGAFRKAKRQIENTKGLFDIDDALRVMVILNDQVHTLDPINIGHEVCRLLNLGESEEPAIDVVWIISEAHQVGQAYPCIVIETEKMRRFEWADEFVSSLNSKWADHNGVSLSQVDTEEFASMRFQDAAKKP